MIGAHELLDLIEEDDIAPPEPLDLLNDPEDEVPNRIYKDRLEFDNVPDRELKKNYRFSRDAILEINELVRDALEHPTDRGFAVSSLTQVLACLRFFASGSFQNILGDVLGFSQSTMSRVLHRFVYAMKRHIADLIKFPIDNENWVERTNNFYVGKGNFPDVLGVVDGCHVVLKKPHIDGDAYYNRKGNVSINCQVRHLFFS